MIPKGQAHIFWQTVHAGAAAEEAKVDIAWNGRRWKRTLGDGSIAGIIPVPLAVLVVLAFFTGFILRYTVLGRYAYAIGVMFRQRATPVSPSGATRSPSTLLGEQDWLA